MLASVAVRVWYQTFAHGEQSCLVAAAVLLFGQNVAYVALGCVNADDKRFCNLFIGGALGHQAENIFFS